MSKILAVSRQAASVVDPWHWVLLALTPLNGIILLLSLFLTPIIRRLPPILIRLPGIDDGLHPNEVAGTLRWVMPALIALSVWLLMHVKTWWSPRRWVGTVAIVGLIIAATFLVAGTFVLTQSRGGYLASCWCTTNRGSQAMAHTIVLGLTGGLLGHSDRGPADPFALAMMSYAS